VNLNTATPELLALLPGIGPAKVQSILAYRKRRAFRTVDELVRVKGVSRKMVRALRPHLAVGGPSTATPARSAVAPPVTPVPPPRPPPKPPPTRPPTTTVCSAWRPPARAARPPAVPAPLAARRYCLRPP
jgi:competence ComEA-like helix-hairpin-helix protein